jgi:hypothetical protein
MSTQKKEIVRADRPTKEHSGEIPPETALLDHEEEMPEEMLSGDEIPLDSIPEIMDKQESGERGVASRETAPAAEKSEKSEPSEPAAAAEPLRQAPEPEQPPEPHRVKEPPKQELASGVDFSVLLSGGEPIDGPVGEAHARDVSSVLRAIEDMGGKIVFKQYRGSSEVPSVISVVIPGSGYRVLMQKLRGFGEVVRTDVSGSIPGSIPGMVPEDAAEIGREELQVRIRFLMDDEAGSE